MLSSPALARQCSKRCLPTPPLRVEWFVDIWVALLAGFTNITSSHGSSIWGTKLANHTHTHTHFQGHTCVCTSLMGRVVKMFKIYYLVCTHANTRADQPWEQGIPPQHLLFALLCHQLLYDYCWWCTSTVNESGFGASKHHHRRAPVAAESCIT